MARLYSFTPLLDLLIVVGLGLLYMVILDLIKVLYYRRADKGAAPLHKVQTAAQVKPRCLNANQSITRTAAAEMAIPIADPSGRERVSRP